MSALRRDGHQRGRSKRRTQQRMDCRRRRYHWSFRYFCHQNRHAVPSTWCSRIGPAGGREWSPGSAWRFDGGATILKLHHISNRQHEMFAFSADYSDIVQAFYFCIKIVYRLKSMIRYPGGELHMQQSQMTKRTTPPHSARTVNIWNSTNSMNLYFISRFEILYSIFKFYDFMNFILCYVICMSRSGLPSLQIKNCSVCALHLSIQISLIFKNQSDTS